MARKRSKPRIVAKMFQVKMIPSGAWAGLVGECVQAVTSSQAFRSAVYADAEAWAMARLRGKQFTIEAVLVDITDRY